MIDTVRTPAERDDRIHTGKTCENCSVPVTTWHQHWNDHFETFVCRPDAIDRIKQEA